MADETAAGDDEALGDNVTRGAVDDELLKLSVTQLQSIALRLTSELVVAKRDLSEALVAKSLAEKQRDEAIEKAAEVVKRTAVLIEKVGSLQLSPKARMTEVRETFSTDVAELYGEDFAVALGTMKP